MSALADFHFLRPWWLLALLALPLLWWAVRYLRGNASTWRALVDAHLLPHVLERSDRPRSAVAWWPVGLVWLVVCGVMAGPAWQRVALPLYHNDAARILALELDVSMLATDVKPTRLGRARFKIDDMLQQSRDLQTALIGYAGDAFVAAPLTDDINTVRNLVSALEPSVMPVGGNATERAIERALRLMEQSGLGSAQLIILADSASPLAAEAARQAYAKGLRTFVLGIGSEGGAPVALPQGGFLQDAQGNIVVPRLQETDLRALAAAGGGRYARMTVDRSDIDSLLGDVALARALGQRGQVETERFRDEGPWLLLLLLPLTLLLFRRGWLMGLAVMVLLPTQHADAFSFSDLWLRADQQAARALADDDVARARALATTSEWRGSADYRDGDFAAAEKEFAASPGAVADYNRGNALAKQQRYEEALAAYQRALEADPQMADATANEEAVRQWLQQQPPPDQQSEKPDKSDQSGESGQQASDEEQDSGTEKSESADGQDARPDQKPSGQDADAAQDQAAGGEAGKDEQDNEQGSPATSDEAKADAAEAEQQQRELSTAIDQALQQQSDGEAQDEAKRDKGEAEHAAMTPAENAAHEQQQALQQWLQRVPDDPGGLLRRKFQLEYERRQRGGGNQ